ncbi:MAG: hypothetical protein WC352_04055, partial [Candidatus Omnitrophota bacterium]
MKLWLRGIALATCVTFTATNTVMAGDPSSIQSALRSPSSSNETEQYVRDSAKGFFQALDLPESICQIKKSYQGASDRIVVHIQDAHVNEEAQRNIAKILDYFIRRHGLKLVNVEGAEGELYPAAFNFYPDESVRRSVADYYLKKGRLAAAEYLAITQRPDMKLFGVEDSALYEENRRAYVEALSFKSPDEKILAEIGKVLAGVGRFVFTDAMRELVRRRSQFQEGGRELVAYVRFLIEEAGRQNVPVHEYPGLASLVGLIEMERAIDFEQAEKEIESLSADLKQILSRERLSRFLTNSVQFRMKKMRRADYYGYLESEIGALSEGMSAGDERTLAEKYENVLKYLRYIRLYDSIDLDVFSEIEGLENAIKSKLLGSADEVTLDRLVKIHAVMQKCFDFSLTKQDASFFYAFRDEFKSRTFKDFLEPLIAKHRFSYGLPSQMEMLDQDLVRVERFYAAALRRDGILIGNAVERMERGGDKIAVIITGGFHTPGIEKFLKERGYSFLTIAPKISGGVDSAREAATYEAALAEKPMPLVQTLAESLLVPKSSALNDPRFQLAVRYLISTLDAGADVFEKSPEARAYMARALLATVMKHEGVEAAEKALLDALALEPGLRDPDKLRLEGAVKAWFREALFERVSGKNGVLAMVLYRKASSGRWEKFMLEERPKDFPEVSRP